MSYFDDSSSDESSVSYLAEDPLERLLSLSGDEGEADDAGDKKVAGPLSPPPPESAPRSPLKTKRNGNVDTSRETPSRMGTRQTKNKPLTDEEIIARIIAERIAAIDREDRNDSPQSSPEDPLLRLLQMEEAEKEKTKSSSIGDKKKNPDEDTSSQPTPEQQIVARIVAMRLAAIDAEGEDAGDDASINSNPEDPLIRIMNMKAEDTLASAMALMQFEVQQNPSDSDDWGEYDDVLQKRDIFDINAMIEKGDLQQLEYRAGTLARILKKRLGDPEESEDFVSPNDTSLTSDADKGYLALVKDAVNRSYIIEEPNTSATTDNGNKQNLQLRYVSMTGAIPDGPRTTNNNPAHDDSTTTLDESDFFDAEEVPIHLDESPRKKIISSNVDVSFSDWWGVVGDLAGIRSDSDTFSDSRSNLSYVSSTDSVWTDSVTSMDAPGKDVAAEVSPTKKSKKEGKVGIFDFNSIQSAIRKSESSSTDAKKPHASLLDEKRRKKRELEAWKTSISRSMHSAD